MYQRAIVTFLDILGFGGIVDSANAETVKSILTSLRLATEPTEHYEKRDEIAFLTFSDCTIRAAYVDTKSNKKYSDGVLFYELLNLVHAQARLIQDGYFLRGAVTIGGIHIDGPLVFGPAMVKAYNLESEFAVHPRIVLDPELLHAFESDPLLRSKEHTIDDEREYIRKLTRTDSDGLVFIDYLRGILTEFDDEGDDLDFFEAHKALILEHADNHKGLNRIAAKLLWAATYHNAIVRGAGEKFFTSRDDQMDNFLITDDEMSLIYELGDDSLDHD